MKAKCQPCFPKPLLINYRGYLVYPAPLRSRVHQPCFTKDGRLLSVKSALRSRPLTGNSPSMFLNVEGAWSKPTQTQDLLFFFFIQFLRSAMLITEPRCHRASPSVSQRRLSFVSLAVKPEGVSQLFDLSSSKAGTQYCLL